MTDDGAPLQVVGAPRRSLFDAVRPGYVDAAGRRLPGPGGMCRAALQEDGVAGGVHAPSDAVVLGGPWPGEPRGWWVQVVPDRALGVAYGIALTRHRRSAGNRTWVLLEARAIRRGPVLEAAVALADLPPARVVPVLVGGAEDAAVATRVLDGLGVAVREADDDDAWSVVSALDHAERGAAEAAVAVVAAHAGRDLGAAGWPRVGGPPAGGLVW